MASDAQWLEPAKQAALEALARHTGVTDPERPWWNLNMPKALDIMLPAALAAVPGGDWRQQITTREALRSELIRQHLAGECGDAVLPRRRWWQRVGNDGLTRQQRTVGAKRWREGQGAPWTPTPDGAGGLPRKRQS